MKRLLFILLTASATNALFAQSVGIGTTVPNNSAQLDVSSTARGLLIPRMTGTQRNNITSPANGLIVYQTNTEILPPSSPGFYLHESGGWKRMARADEISGGTSTWTVSGANQYSNVTGSVSVGTSSPDGSALLDIASITKGVLLPRMTTSQRFNITAPANGLLIYDTDKDEFYHYNGAGWTPILNGGYWTRPITSRSRIANTADSIGMGTSAPTERLDVRGNALLMATKPFLVLNSTASAIFSQSGIRFSNSNTGNLGNIVYTNSGLYLSGSDTTATGNPSPNMFIKNNGFIGIGTDDPQSKLHIIAGDILMNSLNPTIQLQNAAVDKGFIQLSNNDIRIGTNASNTTGRFIIRTNNTDQVYVDPNGNMGFGVSAPLAKIHILNGDDVSISTHGFLMLGSVTGLNLIFDKNEIMARDNGTTSSLILQNDGGTVRIGNVAVPSGYKFAVNGKMICEELKVKLASSGWPDYVFADNYKLKPLQEVEQFIAANKHLPNIPSAAAIEKNGIEVGDMQKRMMEKIEELTLYIIELKKEIDGLKRSNNQ